MRGLCALLALATVFAAPAWAASPVTVVAAENFYADVVRQVGRANVKVGSILSSPDEDPHLFEASASTARRIANARLVVYNGAGYDPWFARLLAASGARAPEVIVVAELMQRHAGDNPHLWYDPKTMPALARRVAAVLARLDPKHVSGYAARLAAFEASLAPLTAKIAALRKRYAGTPITATEPVFGYMAAALGLDMRNPGFQRSVMNGTEPSAAEIATFVNDLRRRAVRVLLYNRQTSGPLTERMRALAAAAGVPVVGVTETEPPGENYQEWMLSQLNALARALARR